ncbi:MAG: DNA translocase FtsK [Nitrospirota bacterium]|nr:DNA translocase FtsK [Nitrospirota bacterium]
MAERLKKAKEEILGVVSLLGSVYLGLSLYSYSRWDPSFLTFTDASAKNYGGIAGAYISDFLITLLGLSSFSLPVFMVAYGIRRILGKKPRKAYMLGAVLFVFSSSLMGSLIISTFNLTAGYNHGGISGAYITGFLEKYLSILGAYLFSLAAFLASVILLSPLQVTSLSFKWKRHKSPARQKKPEKAVIKEEIIIREPVKSSTGPLFTESVSEPPAVTAPRKTATISGYKLPHPELLTLYDPSLIRPSKEDLLSNSALLENKLGDFDVEGKITHVHSGPVVTMYEFEPAPGVKINRVVTLSDDLALALKAQSIRVAPLPGKSTIGIEVPNSKRELVSMREIISSDNFRKSISKLTLALGKDIFGNPIIADLTKMPHLLVAGATGAGKSVSINSMVTSILYKASPEEVKMLMIDPKLLELSIYDNIPHLISPVITNPKEAAEALRKMVFEMERRYRLLAEKGVRNIESFNRRAPEEEKLPYIVVFIDELADLMFASAKDVEDSIARLAQMARASGIHLIIATQRPSVDVITGVIKANFSARIAFRVFSKIDSRTILDTQGAESLLGKGDMLLMLPGSRIMRVHGTLITEDEINAVSEFIKAQASPDFSIYENISTEKSTSGEASGERDEIYHKALDFAESTGEVSISSLQRRFKIGYNRAARIMEIMEDDGLVGQPKGAGKPRDFIGRRF